MRLVVLLALLAGCYSPKVVPGAPCGPGDSCPEDLECDTAITPPTCVEQRGDAGTSEPDVPVVACNGGIACPADQPICENDVCRTCVADNECASDACHELAGTCVDEADVIYMAPGALGTTCTRTAPCGDPDTAMNQVSATRHTVKLADGLYESQLKLDGNQTGVMVLISGPDASPGGVTLAPDVGRAVDGNDSSLALIEGITITSVNDVAILSRGDLTLRNVVITQAQRQGIDIRGGTVRLGASTVERCMAQGILLGGGTLESDRSIVSANVGGGIDVNNGIGRIKNTVIADNGTTNSAFGGVRVGLSGDVEFEFNTVIRNRTGGTIGGGFACSSPADVVRNSILADNGGDQIGPFCGAQFTLFSPTGPNGSNNVIGSPMLDNAATGFHITDASPAKDAADPATAVMIDIDGDRRPEIGGTRADIGADELP